MQIFTDTNRVDWSIELTVGSIKRVKQLTGVDLLDIQGGQLLTRLADDPVVMADVLYAVVQPQASARNISDEQFGASLDGTVIGAAIEKFTEELICFFLHYRPAIGQVLKTLWAKLARCAEQMETLAIQKMESAEIDKVVARELEKAGAEVDRAIAEALGK